MTSRYLLSILWWSSKTVRRAEQRLLELKNSRNAPAAILIEALSDYVITIEGGEPVRIFQDANEDLHETVFLVPDEGLTLDPAQVKFVEATDDAGARVEFHFPREVEGFPQSILNRRKSSLTAKPRRKLRAQAGRTRYPSGRNFILA